MKEVLVNPEKCLGCKSCELACAVEHSQSKDLVGALSERELPQKRVHVTQGKLAPLPLQCRHCAEAPCVDACMTGALQSGPEGLVNLDIDRCVGCWMCIMTCPFGAINPHRDRKQAVKCDRCAHLEQPACVMACPTKALVFIEPVEQAQSNRQKTAYRVLAQFK